MEQTECSETSAYEIQMPRNYPEESIQHSEHGKSLKSSISQSLPSTGLDVQHFLKCFTVTSGERHCRTVMIHTD